MENHTTGGDTVNYMNDYMNTVNYIVKVIMSMTFIRHHIAKLTLPYSFLVLSDIRYFSLNQQSKFYCYFCAQWLVLVDPKGFESDHNIKKQTFKIWQESKFVVSNLYIMDKNLLRLDNEFFSMVKKWIFPCKGDYGNY